MVPDSIILTLEVVILGVQSELVHVNHLLTWNLLEIKPQHSKQTQRIPRQLVRRSDLSFDFALR